MREPATMKVKLTSAQASGLLVLLGNKCEEAANSVVVPDTVEVEFECEVFEVRSEQMYLVHEDGTRL